MTFTASLQKRVVTCALACVAAVSLSGCAGLLIGGAAVGTVAATDRRTLGTQTEDKELLVKATKTANAAIGPREQVEVTVYNRSLLLTGVVTKPATKAQIGRDVERIDGVLEVINDIDVGAYLQWLSDKAEDAFITTKIKTALLRVKGLESNAIKVTTVKGRVYLMGRVTQHEAKVAAETAREVGGVNQVNKMFMYVTENDLIKR